MGLGEEAVGGQRPGANLGATACDFINSAAFVFRVLFWALWIGPRACALAGPGSEPVFTQL